MKRFWLVMLSLGLVLAFSASAMAVDVKFSGSFYAAGMYLDKTTFMNTTATSGAGGGSDNVSTAFYFQRLRVKTDFIVSPGLSLVTRFDAMERAWGAPRSTAAANSSEFSSAPKLDAGSSGTVPENENIAFDLAYIQWVSPVGVFQVGYVNDGQWGTQFGDSDGTIGKIQWILPVGPAMFTAYVGKVTEYSKTAKLTTGGNATTSLTDGDTDKYVLTATYNVNKDISVGFLYAYQRIAQFKSATTPLAGVPAFGALGASPALIKAHVANPYAKAKFGPVSLEAEVDYTFGKVNYENNYDRDISIGMLSAYIGAMVDLGPVYFGGKFAYISGDDPTTSDKWEGGQIGGGYDWNPTLIMFNRERTYWAGGLPGWNSTSADNSSGLLGACGMTNAWFGQGIIGGRPIAALDIQASLAYAAADQKPSGVLNGAYGWEIDVTGTYKITNNLSYMLGVGYFFTGDYFKGNLNTQDIRNDYLLINKLTLTF